MDKTYLFYALSASSEPDVVRYIGVTTKTIEKRFYQHKYCALHKRDLPVHKWMYSHMSKGDTILCKQIGQSSDTGWEQIEKDLISQYKEGGRLLNVDDGGKGIVTKEKRTKDSINRSIEGHFKKIALIDYFGNVIDICNSCSEAVQKFGISKTAIGNVLSGRSRTANGYYIVTNDTLKSPGFDPIKYVDNCNKESKIKLVFEFNLDGTLKNIYKSKSSVGIDKGTLNRAIVNKWSFSNSFWALSRSINIKEYTIREN